MDSHLTCDVNRLLTVGNKSLPTLITNMTVKTAMPFKIISLNYYFSDLRTGSKLNIQAKTYSDY